MLTIDELKERAEECMNRDECLFCSWFKDAWCDKKTFARETLETLRRIEAAQSKWISVDERLPETDERVMFVDDGEVGFGIVRGWALKEMIAETDIHRITHWMPLPQAPEVGKDD